MDTLVVSLPGAHAVEFCRAVPRTVALRLASAQFRVAVPTSPIAVVAIVDDEADSAGISRNQLHADVAATVAAWEPSLDWVVQRADNLMLAVGAFIHPILDALYQDGRRPLGEVPGWASPLLRHSGVDRVATDLAGGRRNKRLTRVVAASLLADRQRVDLMPLGLGVAASGLVSVDELANVVEVATGRSGVVAPTFDEVRSIRAAIVQYPAERRSSLLSDIALNHTPASATPVLTRFSWVATRVDRPLPLRLSDLSDVCDRLIPVLAPPPERVTALPAEQPAPRPRRARRVGTTPLPAPQTTWRAPTRWSIPSALRGVNGHRLGDLSLVVPTSQTELNWWGHRLDNCLGSYAAAAAEERSWLIGVQRDDLVIGCIEVNPETRRIRQALGRKNRLLPRPIYDEVVAALRSLKVIHVGR